LVFSTLHTSYAAGALPRLRDLGAEPFLLSSTINAIVGQRIVRRICENCKTGYIPASPLLDEMRKVLGNLYPTLPPKHDTLYKGAGCAVCGHTGYVGRVGIFEVLPVSEKLGHLVLENPDSALIQNEAVAEGMITMQQDGYLKVLRGVTTIEEVMRVAQA
jgi:general secretion pathway protein E